MSDFSRKNKRSPLQQSILALGGIAMLLLISVLIVADVKIYHKKQQLSTQVEHLKKQVKEYEEMNNELRQGITRENDEQYIEKVAREELGLKKEGETVVSFVKVADQSPAESPAQKDYWQAWFGWMGSRWNWLMEKFNQ